MSYNPLIDALEKYEQLLDAQGDVMHAVGGEAVFEPFNDKLCDVTVQFIVDSADAVKAPQSAIAACAA